MTHLSVSLPADGWIHSVCFDYSQSNHSITVTSLSSCQCSQHAVQQSWLCTTGRRWCRRSLRGSAAASSWTKPASTLSRAGSHMTRATSPGKDCRSAERPQANCIMGNCLLCVQVRSDSCGVFSGRPVPCGGRGPGGGVRGPSGDCSQQPEEWRPGPATPGPGKYQTTKHMFGFINRFYKLVV